MSITFRLLGAGDEAVLRRVAPEVFDGPVDPPWSAEFLSDPRHHIAVAPTRQRRGIGRRLVEMLLAHGRTLGCSEAWVLTDDADNEAAHALYASTGGRPSPEGSVTMYTFPLSAEGAAGRSRR